MLVSSGGVGDVTTLWLLVLVHRLANPSGLLSDSVGKVNVVVNLMLIPAYGHLHGERPRCTCDLGCCPWTYKVLYLSEHRIWSRGRQSLRTPVVASYFPSLVQPNMWADITHYGLDRPGIL